MTNIKERPPERANVVIPLRHMSQLYRTDASRWMAMVRELESASGPMLAYYAPFVAGCNAELRQAGGGLGVMTWGQRDFGSNPTSLAVIQHSKDSLAHMARAWRDEFPELIGEIPERAAGYRYVDFRGHRLKGGFHARAADKKGNEVLLYYHASDWKPEALKAHVELLTIVAEVRHGMPRESIRVLDFRERAILTPPKTFVALRPRARTPLRALRAALRLAEL